jgi:hypothetical protein
MKIFVFSALGLLLGVFLFLWMITRIRYRIGSRHVKVILFGVCLRRVALANIDSISKRPGQGWTEHWWSTTHPKHRVLVIRRRRGLFKNFVITPKNRYIFKTDLERAVRRVGGTLGPSSPDPLDRDPLDPAEADDNAVEAENGASSSTGGMEEKG